MERGTEINGEEDIGSEVKAQSHFYPLPLCLTPPPLPLPLRNKGRGGKGQGVEMGLGLREREIELEGALDIEGWPKRERGTPRYSRNMRDRAIGIE